MKNSVEVSIFLVLLAAFVFASVGCASAATRHVNPGESIQVAPASSVTLVALFEDYYPWGYAIEDYLAASGISFTTYRSSDMGEVNLTPYTKVITASVQGDTFWDALAGNKTWFEDYVSKGGVLEMHLCAQENRTAWGKLFPGGFVTAWGPTNTVSIVNTTHPVVNIPNKITDQDLDQWGWSAHGNFSTIPAGATVVLTDTNTGKPVFVEAKLGNGSIIATTQTVEYIARDDYPEFLGNMILFMLPTATYFDTGAGTYPSIGGTHNGTITPFYNINVTKLYTYSSPGTGGHTEYAAISYSNGTKIAKALWNGYSGDWHNITFNKTFTLYANETYNYTIRTGSYPQIIHEREFNATGGTITCTKFMDANGKEHYDWIPAIRLEAEEIRIGIVAPLTGDASTAGNDMWQSAILAADEINAKGGVNVNGVNMKITLVKGDTQTSDEGGVKAVTKLITEDKVDLLVGGYSTGVTLAGQVVAAEHKVPFIITGAAYPAVTRRTDINTSYFFHHCPTTDDFANSTLLFLDEIVKPQIYERFNFSAERPLRLAVLYQDSSYGKAVYDGINKTIEHYNLSMEVVAAEKFTQGETDYTSVLSTIKAAEPDIVYPAAFVNEQPLIVAQGRRDVGLNTTYLSVECNDDPEYYTGVESWGEYSIQESRFSPYAIPPSPIYSAVVEFKEDYENRWGTSPGMMGASTYEGVYIAAKAIENAGTIDKEEIRDALTEIEMPQLIELMKDDVITFSSDYRESKFELYMQQLIWNESVGETRPKIVWPDSIKETDFVLPDWYEPGSP
jgi:branched-chain amino acid transport system substrate-binding protein